MFGIFGFVRIVHELLNFNSLVFCIIIRNYTRQMLTRNVWELCVELCEKSEPTSPPSIRKKRYLFGMLPLFACLILLINGLIWLSSIQQMVSNIICGYWLAFSDSFGMCTNYLTSAPLFSVELLQIKQEECKQMWNHTRNMWEFSVKLCEKPEPTLPPSMRKNTRFVWHVSAICLPFSFNQWLNLVK